MFLIIVLKGFGNIPLQNKDTEVASVQKICLIKLFFSILKIYESSEFGFGFQQEIQMTRTLFFHIVIQCSGNSEKILTTNQFLVSITYFTDINISFSNLCFDIFSVIVKNVNQIRNNVVYVVARLVFAFLLCTHYGPLQHFSTYFRKSKEIGVSRPIFPDYV